MMNNSLLLRRGKLLEYATLGWNIIGVIVLAMVAPVANSVALIAFGFDTLLEIGASTIVIWELNGASSKRQKPALRLLSTAFLTLGFYLVIQSTLNVMHHTFPYQSNAGMIWLLLTFIAMSLLAYKKAQVGKLLANKVLITEGRVTLVDAGLAFVVLISMFATRWLSWGWADVIGGMILAAYCFWESRHAWHESKNN
jgi:divalent metal cation (Fe/Co/Zn/Cd) transporter